MFTKLYEWVLQWAKHRYANWALGGLSFAESSFFPIPPDVLLAPMVLAKPMKAWQLALLTTIMSVLGGVLGYLIGAFGFDLIQDWIAGSHWEESLAHAKALFAQYGIWIVFMAGFSPVPYKIFTVSAGALAMPLMPFIFASFIGRGLRFFIVAALVRYVGANYEPILRRYIEPLGYLVALLVIVLVGYLSFF